MDVPLLEKRLAEIVARLGLLRFQREGELQRLRAARGQKGKNTALESQLRETALEIAQLKKERLAVASQLVQARPQKKKRYIPPGRRKA